MRVLLVALVLAAMLGGRADAEWHRERVLARGVTPRAAAPSTDSGLRLWGGDLRLGWRERALVPQRSSLPPFAMESADTETEWAANARGDVLLVAKRPGSVRAVALDVGGQRAAMSSRVAGGGEVDQVQASVGSDGTGAVASGELRSSRLREG